MSGMTTGFVSYTHADADLKDQLLRHLAPLRRERLIDVWHDAMLRPGEHLDPAVQAALANSDLVLLLVSAGFLASEYCYEQEMVRAFARQRAGAARVVPIILKPCQWKGVPVGEGERLADFVALPKDGLPVTSWPDADAAFDNVAGAVRDMLRSGVTQPAGVQSTATKPAVSSPRTAAVPRASAAMLGIAAKPTDLDRDRFLRAGFATTAAVFETKLSELASSDPRVQTDFERIDTRAFAASVYLDGKRVGQVSIWHGSDTWRNALCLSYDTVTSTRNSMNDWLPIQETPQGLAFGAGNAMSRRSTAGPLDADGAANYFWEGFITQVQARVR